VLCVKRLYSGSVLPVTERETLQYMYMLERYRSLCLLEEFQKLEEKYSYCANLGHEKGVVILIVIRDAALI
jgi:hypothetical protein